MKVILLVFLFYMLLISWILFYHICSIMTWVGLLGCVAPCVLYGSNAERLGNATGTFATQCLSYAGLYLIGKAFCRVNCIAPMFSFPSRTAIRRKFNLEASNSFTCPFFTGTFLPLLWDKFVDWVNYWSHILVKLLV